jgi:MoxR-like ATPase
VEEWVAALAATLEWAAGADEKTRQSRDFQWHLWEENRVASVGQGSISVEGALDDAEFRQWFARRSFDVCPTDTSGRMDFLTEWYHDLRARLTKNFVKRTPHLKVFRVLAVLYPDAMTVVASPAALASLAAVMGADASLGRAARHAWVRGRLDEALGSAPSDWRARAVRLILPWLLYEKYAARVVSDDEPALVPLPAERRFKGLSGTRGQFPAMLSTLEFIGEGVTRQELLDFLAKSSPDAKTSSLSITINGLRSEFGVARKDGNRLVLTDRGRQLLDSENPDVLADWLLMRVLGPDWLIARLRDEGPLPLAEVTKVLQELNPGWTTSVMPGSIRSWLVGLGVLGVDGKSISLTPRGQEWAARITWKPEALARVPVDIPDDGSVQPPVRPVLLPDTSAIVSAVRGSGQFAASLVARLHSGLWAHPRRHFAVLSGLSGAGKTLLARAYASAITSGDEGVTRRITVPVQPGWHDSGALLGFVNPLRGESYVRTPFLEFLINAAQHPDQPYVAVLDEMNLSHPEQYMAPLLSAMETGEPIALHTEGDTFDGVPGLLPYPSNLVLIGTINMDETTHGLSDKVLDRAFVVEFWDVDLESYPRWGTTGIESAHEQATRALVFDLMAALTPARLHFGWRVVDDVFAFLTHASSHAQLLPFEEALDDVVYAKVLPKLRGEDTPRLRTALDACIVALKTHGLVRSEAKARELREELLASGSMRFWR